MPLKSVESIAIAASIDAVFRAVVGPQGLATWFADEARSEKKAGGRVQLAWHGGNQAVGRWIDFDAAASRATLRARLEADGEVATFAFEVSAVGDRSTVRATVDPGPTALAAPWSRIWRHALQDLRLYCEKGRAGSLERQPMLGLHFDQLSETTAKAKGIPVTEGILVTKVLEGSGAERAGIQDGDAIVSIDERPVADWGSVAPTLQEYAHGDHVAVRLWRGPDAIVLDVVLGPRIQPPMLSDADAIRDAYHETTEKGLRELHDLVDDITEAQAMHTPAEGEWSIKQVLAHLSDLERWFADDTARMAGDDPSVGWASEALVIRTASLCAWPVSRLAARVEMDVSESLALVDKLLQGQPHPATLYRISESLTWAPDHFREHLGQIADNLASARAAGVA